MTSFTEALTALIDQQHNLGYACSRDEIAAGDKNVRIAYEVFGEPGLLDEFWQNRTILDFGTFENCREYGLTVTVGGWTFAAYEHRNSDDICIEGCPVADVQEYGPYGGEDKYDVLFSTRWKQYHEASEALVAIVRHLLINPDATRADLKRVASTTTKKRSA